MERRKKQKKIRRKRIKPDGRSPNRFQPTCGVYCIIHDHSGRRYVGSSIEIEKRLYLHLVLLRKGTHHCPYLQNVWNKYGESQFSFWLLAKCGVSELESREQLHMDQTANEKSMNCHPAAGSARGFKASDETRRKQSEAAKRVAADPAERKRRSDRAKAMHRDRRITYHRRAKTKTKVCKHCDKEFWLKRHPTRRYWRQHKLCSGCRRKYKVHTPPIQI